MILYNKIAKIGDYVYINYNNNKEIQGSKSPSVSAK